MREGFLKRRVVTGEIDQQIELSVECEMSAEPKIGEVAPQWRTDHEAVGEIPRAIDCDKDREKRHETGDDQHRMIAPRIGHRRHGVTR